MAITQGPCGRGPRALCASDRRSRWWLHGDSFARYAVVGGLLVRFAACSANDDIPAPVLASVTPAHASVGTVVMISGDFLCQQPEQSSGEVDPLACAHMGEVQFGVVPANPTQYTDTAITALVPDLPAGAIDLTVAVGGRTTNSIGFTVDGQEPSAAASD